MSKTYILFPLIVLSVSSFTFINKQTSDNNPKSYSTLSVTTDMQTEACAHAMSRTVLALNALSEEDHCALVNILSNSAFTDQQKFDAMAGNQNLLTFRGTMYRQMEIMLQNSICQVLNDPNRYKLFEIKYFEDLGIPNIGSDGGNCNGWRIAIRQCLKSQTICCSGCLISGGVSASTALCLIICAYDTLECGAAADNAYPGCAGGIIINPWFDPAYPGIATGPGYCD